LWNGNTALIDGTADAMHPEVLIYEPGAEEQMCLVGVEFLVPFSILPTTATPPRLFGQEVPGEQRARSIGASRMNASRRSHRAVCELESARPLLI
jgi:hypothetical protein